MAHSDISDVEGEDSASEGEESSVWDGDGGSSNAQEEEEDLVRKEEELRAELNMATRRVQELRQTLQETKSFMDARGVSVVPGSTKGKQFVPVASIASASDVDDEDEDEFEYEEGSDDFEVRTKECTCVHL